MRTLCCLVVAGLASLGAFAQKGLVITKVGLRDNAYAVAIQSDGKIVAAGATYRDRDSGFALVRYLPDGALDKSFGVNGRVTTRFGGGDDKAYALAIQSDGKILLAGSSFNGKNTDFAVARYLTDGGPDLAFGFNGITRIDVAGKDDRASAIAVTAEGVIYLSGSAKVQNTDDFAVVALAPSGELSLGFGVNGRVTTEFGAGEDLAYGIALQRDGKLVVAGHSRIGDSTVFTVARYLANGNLDPQWGSSQGRVYTSIGPYNDTAYAVAISHDQKIVVAGSSSNGKGQDFAMVRYLPNGSLDFSFGADGKTRTPIGPGIDNIYSIAIALNGKIVAAGSYFNGYDFDIAAVRYESSGWLDRSFGVDGRALLSMEYRYDAAYAVALQKDGKIVVAGVTNDSVNYGFALVRFAVNGTPDPTFAGDRESKTLVARSVLASEHARIGRATTAASALAPLLNLLPPTK